MGKCWAPGCTHYDIRDKCKFFRFPKEQTMLRKWIKQISRTDLPGKSARLCSCHFIDGEKENGPTVFARNVEKAFCPHYLSPEVKKKRTKQIELKDLPSTSTAIEETELMSGHSEYESEDDSTEKRGSQNFTADKSNQTLYSTSVSLEIQNDMLKRELEEKNKIIKDLSMKFSYEHIRGNDKLVLLYTGFPTTHIFETLYKLIEKIELNYYLNWKVQKLSKIDQLLMTLMKLRHNSPHEDLAVRFNTSQATISNIVLTYVHALHEILFKQFMSKIPSRNKNMSCLPNCFSSFTNCRIILDCTEICTAVPRHSMEKQSATYSSYKHRNTWKGLIGVAPNGVITYASELYPGSTSDKKIVQHCGILQFLEAGDLILADKGFLIRDILPAGVTLNIPPFLTVGQFTEEQVYRTESIARARIHVERAIQRMKIYNILTYVPESLFSYATIIFQVVAALTNLQYPLIREVGQYYVDV